MQLLHSCLIYLNTPFTYPSRLGCLYYHMRLHEVRHPVLRHRMTVKLSVMPWGNSTGRLTAVWTVLWTSTKQQLQHSSGGFEE